MTRAAWLVAGTAALWLHAARADVLHSTREQPLVEVSHAVDITVDKGVAIYKVRRVFANPGKVADEAGLAIDLPYGAAATGLRIRAHDTWYDGELMERDKAAALYHEMTGLGAYRPKDPALLQWLWADKLYLQVFPIQPGEVSTVEYTLTVPTRYEGGRYWVSYPRSDAKQSGPLSLATPVVTVHTGWNGAVVVDGKRAPEGTSVVLDVPPRPDWADVVQAEPSASYAASAIDIPESSHTSKAFASATVVLDLSHTYRSDLRVELVTPQGKRVILHDRTGGGANDLKGAFPVDLPPGTVGAGAWRLVASDHAALDTGTIDAWQLQLGDTTVAAADTPVFIPDAPESPSDAGVATIAIAPPAIATWALRLGRVVASDAHAFSRLEIDMSPQLVPVPKQAQVVFVVDASYSMGELGLAAQLDVMRAYLTHVPDAAVEIVAYRRHAARVFGRWVPAKDVETALAAAPIALGNGSAIDDGARLAVSLLADRRGPRRVVLLTDELVRSSLDPAAALASLAGLPKDVVVHVVTPSLDRDDRAELARRDSAALAPLATNHHGIFADLHGLPARSIKDLAPAVLELVRPTRVERVALAGGDKAMQIPDVLKEGAGVRVMTLDASAPSRLVLTGVVWSDPVRAEVDAGELFSTQTAAFVFGADEHQSLSHDEMMKVAMMGRAVSPVTSYVAAEPGTRPSPIGFETIGHGSGTGAGYGFGSGHGALRGGHPALASLVDATACKRNNAPADVVLAVETTRSEIVDVAVTGTTSALATCIAEVVWTVRLPDSFSRGARDVRDCGTDPIQRGRAISRTVRRFRGNGQRGDGRAARGRRATFERL